MSVEPTPYGTWRARWRDASGRNRAKTFKRRHDAEVFERATLTDLHRGYYVDTRPLTVAAWADQWLASARNLGPGGLDTYHRDLNRHILPALGTVALDKLTPSVIDLFLTDQLRTLAPSTVHRHYRTLRRMCEVAVQRGRLGRNPCATVHPPRLPQVEMRFLTVAQVDTLADAIGARYRAWVHLACYGGLRWSETVGLRRSQVDGTKVTVLEQLVRRGDKAWHREAPKTRAGRRVVALPAFAAESLGVHLATYSAAGADGLVFPNQAGRPIAGASFTGNVFKPALVRAGIDRRVRIHDLRHTAVALAIAAGAHPKAIQARMGHASIAVTLDRYGHLMAGIDEDVASELDRLRDRG